MERREGDGGMDGEKEGGVVEGWMKKGGRGVMDGRRQGGKVE